MLREPKLEDFYDEGDPRGCSSSEYADWVRAHKIWEEVKSLDIGSSFKLGKYNVKIEKGFGYFLHIGGKYNNSAIYQQYGLTREDIVSQYTYGEIGSGDFPEATMKSDLLNAVMFLKVCDKEYRPHVEVKISKPRNTKAKSVVIDIETGGLDSGKIYSPPQNEDSKESENNLLLLG